jgi:hypothetical protein
MGYSIYIGNAVFDDVDEYDPQYRATVAGFEHPDAPRAPHDANPGKNYRWPSYGVWTEFTKTVGLHDMFYDEEDGLLRPHPGCAVLRRSHCERIELALKHFREAHADAVARFEGREGEDPVSEMLRIDAGKDLDCGPHDATLARLEWLAWWCRWAVENCERPAVKNS